jgi:cysteine desulfurase
MIPWARARGIQVTVLPLRSDGQPCYETFQQTLKQPCKPTLISLLWVNNETGVVLSRPALGDWLAGARSAGAVFHLDGAQAWGKFKLELDRLGADFITFSGHKIGGMAGSGGVWISPERAVNPRTSAGRLILGKAEGGRRGGTASVLAALLLGEAAAAINPELAESAKKFQELTAEFESELQGWLGDSITINGKDSLRVAGTTNVSFHGISGEGLVAALDLEGFAVSAGAACSSGTLEASHVLMAMGIPAEVARASLRISLPKSHELAQTRSDLRDFLRALDRVLGRMRSTGRVRGAS